jgi:hypothetical protein
MSLSKLELARPPCEGGGGGRERGRQSSSLSEFSLHQGEAELRHWYAEFVVTPSPPAFVWVSTLQHPCTNLRPLSSSAPSTNFFPVAGSYECCPGTSSTSSSSASLSSSHRAIARIWCPPVLPPWYPFYLQRKGRLDPSGLRPYPFPPSVHAPPAHQPVDEGDLHRSTLATFSSPWTLDGSPRLHSVTSPLLEPIPHPLDVIRRAPRRPRLHRRPTPFPNVTEH